MSDGFTIVTYVHPLLMGQNPPAGNNMGNASTPSILPFLKGHLKALATIQIMIGVVTFLFGIVLAFNWNIPISVISGIVYWGSLIYIITGSLSVAAEPKLHPCLRETVRVIGVLAVLSLLQFFISICISAFACKATCCSEPMVPVVTIAHPAHINPQGINGVTYSPPTGSPPAYSMAESQLTN
ncbi:membrane-spanning 4-domains subfamily A member 18 [Ictalurus punctatus]|uniref:Membrane-spanning 4-domains subfamily A member 18 n=1 Tax=Ictalurus punctatus TaxID=7998 RepID=A0A9F7TLZ5_ICTPU|nr:membrane-spanning 4-domains subfamily A member 18 [Ictalurus punctatus]